MEKMDAWANGEMHEKKGEKKNPSFSRSRMLLEISKIQAS